MGRIACAYVPRFELALRARADPGLWDRPAAAVDWASRPPRLLCVTPAAEQLGAAVGQFAARARARLPELVCLPPDAALREKAEREVLAALAQVAPRLDCDRRGAFFLGLEGLERLWPDEAALFARLTELFRALSLTAQLAIAPTPFSAWIAAQQRRSPPDRGAALPVAPLRARQLSPPAADWLVVAPGEEAALLARLPLAELDLSEPIRELCALLGLRSAAALAALPPGALAERLGPAGARLERLCRGEAFAVWPTAAMLPRAPEWVELELELALEGLEPLLFALQSLLERLLAALGAERQALAELTVEVRLDDRSEVVERFTPERPTLSSGGLLELLKLWLERRPFAAQVARLRLVASRTAAPHQVQLSLLRQREEQAQAAHAQALARLAAAFGAGSVLRPTLRDTFRPEARLSWVSAVAAVAPARSSGPAVRFASAPLALALRQVDPPERVGVQAHCLTRAQRPPARILRSEGPQRLSGEWWVPASAPGEAPGYNRSYHWLLLETGELAWIYRDERTRELFLQAVAD